MKYYGIRKDGSKWYVPANVYEMTGIDISIPDTWLNIPAIERMCNNGPKFTNDEIVVIREEEE